MNPKRHCRQCGTCCKKGGPSLHLEDIDLIKTGKIQLASLYTIREGELAHDNVKDLLVPVTSELIKIKGRDNTWTCLFFNDSTMACTIYRNRPLECQVLECWDTSSIEKIYDINRLTRKELISDVQGLWDLVTDHNHRCSYKTLRDLSGQLNLKDGEDIAREIIEIVNYDKHIRELVIKKAGVAPDMTDFMFGRPLMQTIVMFGLKIDHCDGVTKLVNLSQRPPL